MPLSFPTNPTAGDTYSYNGKLWYYDGTRWYSRYEVLQASNTESVSIAVGTELQRPSTPTNGDFRINSTTGYLEVYYDTWIKLNYLSYILGAGGEIHTAGDYRIHTFKRSGVFSIIDAPVDATIEYLLVGGGGGGGETIGGGGGAGEVKYSTISVASSDTFTVTIGSGGAGGWDPSANHGPADNGTATSILRGAETITALGGGGGGGYNTNASTAGSVAHGGGYGAGNGVGRAAGIGFNAGGISSNNTNSGGGGGGAGAAATNSTSGNPTVGGIGIGNPIVGSTFGEYNPNDELYYIAAGGGGGARIPNGGTAAQGGLGGGGNGVTGGITTAPATAHALANTGSGGGAGGYTDSGTVNGRGGNGADGIVIFRYRFR